MQTARLNLSIRTLLLPMALVIVQLVPIVFGKSFLSFIPYVFLTCFVLFVGIFWAEPGAALLAGVVGPFVGIWQGLYPSFWYAVTAAVANGLMISIAALFQKRSMLMGILLSSAFRFAYCWIMVFRIMALFTSTASAASASMNVLFGWPQLISPVLGGIFALPVLYRLQLWRETAFEKTAS